MSENEQYDVIVIGGGPGGATAAMNAARAGLKTVFFESISPASSLSLAPYVENYPGVEGKGYELHDTMKRQATGSGAEYKLEVIKNIKADGGFTVVTESGEYKTRTVIVSSGGKHKELGVEGEKEFTGKGVSYCAVCDGNFFRNKKVLMVGGGYGAMNEAVYLKDIGCDVTLVTKKEKPGSEKVLEEKFEEKEIPYIGRTRVLRIEGSSKVERVVLQNIDTEEEQTVETDAVFIAVGKKPQTKMLASLGVDMDSRGYIKVDKHQKTNVEGLYAAGDCCDNPLKQVVTACGDGAVAAHSAYKYLRLGKS